jgi:hypothetical protein
VSQNKRNVALALQQSVTQSMTTTAGIGNQFVKPTYASGNGAPGNPLAHGQSGSLGGNSLQHMATEETYV